MPVPLGNTIPEGRDSLMGKGTFWSRCDKLEAIIGHGDLRGVVTVDQVYAQDQHNNLTYNHEGQGIPAFLSVALRANYRGYLNAIADTVLHDGGVSGMIQSMVFLATREMHRYAPIEFGTLRNSGEAAVYKGGALVFDRPANARRLTEAEIKIRSNRIKYDWPETP